MGLKQKSTLAQSLDKGKLNFTNQGQAIHKIIRCNARKEATLRSHHINPAYDHLIHSYDRFHGNLYGFLLTGMISLSMMSICCTILRYFSGVCLTPRVVVGVAPLSLYVNFTVLYCTPPVSSGSLVIAAAIHRPSPLGSLAASHQLVSTTWTYSLIFTDCIGVSDSNG